MTTTSAIPAYGTQLKLGDGGGPETFTAVAELTKINGPKMKVKAEDATHHQGGGWEESIPTIISGGDISCEGNWLTDNATQNESTGVLYVFVNRVKRNWKLVLPDSSNTTFSFQGFVTDFEGDEPVDGKLGLKFTLHVTGPITIS